MCSIVSVNVVSDLKDVRTGLIYVGVYLYTRDSVSWRARVIGSVIIVDF